MPPEREAQREAIRHARVDRPLLSTMSRRDEAVEVGAACARAVLTLSDPERARDAAAFDRAPPAISGREQPPLNSRPLSAHHDAARPSD